MTECIDNADTNKVECSAIFRKKVQADFTGGRLTSDAGAVLLREVDKHIKLIDAINRCLDDPREPSRITHDQRTLLAQRIFGIALGYEDLNDHQTLRDDPVFSLLADKHDETSLASPPTLCRLENRITRDDLVRISNVFVEQFIASHRDVPKELILDFDATDDPVHGQQEGRFFHGYYDRYCFLPLYVFCGDQLLVAYLRESKIDPAQHAWAILALLVKRFRKAWPSVRIIFRGDSGFCRWRMMRWCDRHQVDYIIGLAKNSVLTDNASELINESAERYKRSGVKQRLFGDVYYSAATWDTQRRVIVKAEHLSQGANTRFVVTSLDGDPQRLYEDLYCQRGEMENRIKEQQLMLFADRTSCHYFLSNQFRLLLSSAAYILIETLRRLGLSQTELACAQVSTIRLKLFKIGARVKQSVRRIVLQLSSSYPYKALFVSLMARLRTGSHTSSGPSCLACQFR